MKNIRIITLFIALFIFLFNFCKNDEETPSNVNDYMKATICFEDWNEDTLTTDFTDIEFYSTAVIQSYLADTIIITGNDAGGVPVFTIKMPNTILNDDDHFYTLTDGGIIFVQYDRPDYSNMSHFGTLEITEINTTDNSLSGVFGFYSSRNRADSILDNGDWIYYVTFEQLEVVNGEFTSTYIQ